MSMKIVQKSLLDIQNLDVYVLEDAPGKIVINNQKDGLYVLSNDFLRLGEIKFLESLDISHIYQKRDGTELLLYCANNKRLVHIDIKHFTHTIIQIVGDLASHTLLPFYIWDDVTCILTTNNHMYRLDLGKATIEEANQVMVRENYTTFYNCWKKYRTQEIMFFSRKESIVIVREAGKVKVIFIDPRHHHSPEPLIIEDGDSVIDVRYQGDRLLLVKDKEVEVMDATTGKRAQQHVHPQYHFESARFLEGDDEAFVVLCRDEKKEHDQLRLYTIA